MDTSKHKPTHQPVVTSTLRKRPIRLLPIHSIPNFRFSNQNNNPKCQANSELFSSRNWYITLRIFVWTSTKHHPSSHRRIARKIAGQHLWFHRKISASLTRKIAESLVQKLVTDDNPPTEHRRLCSTASTASTTGNPWIFGSPTTLDWSSLSHSINLSHGLYISVCVTVCRRKENGEMGRGEIRLSRVCGTEERGRSSSIRLTLITLSSDFHKHVALLF